MKIFIVSIALAAVVASVGCATDPNKQVVAADAAHAADLRDEQEKKSELDAEHKQEHAALDSTHDKENGELRKDVADDKSKSAASHNAAEANVVEARRVFRAAAVARLEQVDAKTTVMERAAKKPMPMVTALRAHQVKDSATLKNLDTVIDADWFNAKTSLEVSLAALEKELAACESK